MAQRIASFVSIITLATGLTLTGCGSPPATTAPTDAGPDAWARADGYTPPDSCDMTHLHVLDGVAGGTVSVDFDTRMTTTRPRDLGPACGNPAFDLRWARQEIVEFHVPGTGMQGVHVSTVNTMTDSTFNTLIQVRQGECRMVPTTSFPPNCFDDVSMTNLASDGGITVMGGTTLYFIVTGYSNPPAAQNAVDQGRVHVDFTVTPNTAPVLDSAVALFARADTIVNATAHDAEGPIAGFSMTFFNAGGQLDVNGDGHADANDALVYTFDTVDRTPPMYVGHRILLMSAGSNIATACLGAAMCTQFGIRVFDQQYAISNEVRVPAIRAPYVPLGGTCDGTHLCPDGLTCTGGTCAATSGATSECAGALAFPIPTPAPGTTMAMVHGTIGMGTGVFTESCAATPGSEQIWHITIPAGHYDLALTTDIAGTSAGLDTVIAVRSACLDATTELPMGCNDDIGGGNLHSRVNLRDIAPGDYYVFVELFGTTPASPYNIGATLTPVIASGGACDPTMTNYRCNTGTCSATTMMCP